MTDDSRNIEIKARLYDAANFNDKVKIAENLTGTAGVIIKQHDVFFNSANGRLKLRYLEAPAQSELIFYDRPDTAGPKLSTYNKLGTDDPKTLEIILAKSAGTKGTVKKTRRLFMHNSTRIHLDDVENLGYYLEFEVCLKANETVEEGQQIAEQMLETFKIKNDDLITCAYLDEICKSQEKK